MLVIYCNYRNISNASYLIKLRSSGLVTGILFNKYFNIPIKINLDYNIIHFSKFFLNQRVILVIKGKKKVCILKKIQLHPINNNIINLDFFLI